MDGTGKWLLDEQTEAWHQALKGLLGVSLAVLDARFAILDGNGGLARLLQEGEVPRGQNLLSYLTADSQQEWPQLLQVGAQGMELTFRAADGNAYDVYCRCWRLGDRWLLTGEKPQMADDQVLYQITRLNNELSNMTRELNKKNMALQRANARISELLRTDPLTGIPNRRHFMETLGQRMAYSRRHGASLVLALSDIDHFKTVNDSWGHSVGDRVLAGIARVLAEGVREEDLVARIGGEEFGLLFPGIGGRQALAVVGRLRRQVEAVPLLPREGGVTASFGVAEFQPRDEADSLVQRADRALYRAKDRGRNRIETCLEAEGS